MTPSRLRFRSRPDGQLSGDELADRISTFGLAANERELEQFARRLAATGDSPTLTSIMLDRSAASIVRERAFARALVATHAGHRPLYHVA